MRAGTGVGALVLGFVLAPLHATTLVRGASGLTVSLESTGSYDIAVPSMDWRLGGDIGHPISNVAVQDGSDALGAYS